MWRRPGVDPRGRTARGARLKAVHADVKALLDASLLNRSPEGGIEFPFQAIKVEFMLKAA